jgi:flavin reductase (DIM6/NTAB) family NADH-FMN oxidoreductase RutF
MREENEVLSTVPPADYVSAISRHVSTVCVITTTFEDVRYGLTATAVSSVSAEPPRLLVCINRSSKTHDAILQSRRFCVNVLTEEQRDVAMVFAGMGGKDVDRFATGSWTTLRTGAPVLAGTAAGLDCMLGESMVQGTHTVFFGDVVATAQASDRDTLLYGARQFRQLRKVLDVWGEASDYW